VTAVVLAPGRSSSPSLYRALGIAHFFLSFNAVGRNLVSPKRYLGARKRPMLPARVAFTTWQASLSQKLVGELFLDSSRLTAELTQIVQLGLAYITATLDVDAVDQRAVSLEGTLHTNTV